MDFADFVVQFTARTSGGYTARVVRSPAGEAEEPFDVPAESELAAWAVSDGRGTAASRHSRPCRLALSEAPLRLVGDRLFRSLFHGAVRSRLDESLGLLRGVPDRGLRLRLQAAPGDPALAPLVGLPWELLLYGEQGAFLGLGRQVAVVRSPSLPMAGGRTRIASLPLRVLALACQPRNLPHLDLAGECRSLAGLAHPGRLEVRFLRDATLEGLREELNRWQPHVLHVMGHGDFTARTGEGRLLFLDSQAEAAPVDGPLLADHVRDCPSLQMVYLNACQTARLAAPNPFAGLALALLQAGVPAVVAMQLPVEDDAAITMSAETYRQIAGGEPLEIAVAEGRLAVRRLRPQSMEWATPALFLRAADGQLFGQDRAEAKAGVAPAELASAARAPRRAAGLAWATALTAGLLLGLGGLGVAAGRWGTSTQKQETRSEEAPKHGLEPVAAGPTSAPASVPEPKWGERETHGVERRRVEVLEPKPAATEVAQVIADRPAPARPSSYRVSSEAPVFLADVEAEVSAQFLDAFGQRAYRVFLSPKGGSFGGSPPLLASDSVAFDTVAGKVWIDVLAVDWERQVLTVRARTGS